MGTMINITDSCFHKIFHDFIRESFKENYSSYEYCSVTKVGNMIVFSPQNSDMGGEKTETLLEMFQKENEELKKKLSSYEEKKEVEPKTENKKTLFLVRDTYSDYAVPVKLTDEQLRAVTWLISEFGLEVVTYQIDDSRIKEI